MIRLTTLLRSLGPAGAVANVRVVLDERRRQDWVVDGLLHRIEARPAVPAARPAAPAAGVA